MTRTRSTRSPRGIGAAKMMRVKRACSRRRRSRPHSAEPGGGRQIYPRIRLASRSRAKLGCAAIFAMCLGHVREIPIECVPGERDRDDRGGFDAQDPRAQRGHPGSPRRAPPNLGGGEAAFGPDQQRERRAARAAGARSGRAPGSGESTSRRAGSAGPKPAPRPAPPAAPPSGTSARPHCRAASRAIFSQRARRAGLGTRHGTLRRHRDDARHAQLAASSGRGNPSARRAARRSAGRRAARGGVARPDRRRGSAASSVSRRPTRTTRASHLRRRRRRTA